ncbi:DUF1643 domain-containing protein [Bacillus amyloliquefaciens]|uniref:DUF1643 domain-containing protein n=1 Tax=Bacillus velezensis TaxID=492670 RepID=UPI001ABDE63B|nr:DUF1643 domain-containing protein [Bacillus velezensis]MBO3789666.1 DUF1643 domain-containing protein [Bacillus velezensis]
MAIPFAKDDFVKNVHCKVFHLGANISFRFLLKIKLNNNLRNIITIILMNPSRATATKSDPTIDNIISFFFSKNYAGEIRVLNLFPFYTSDANKLGELLEKCKATYGKKYYKILYLNNKLIEKHLDISERVVCAWGGRPSMLKHQQMNYNIQRQAVHDVFNSTDQANVYATCMHTSEDKPYSSLLTNKKNPRHYAYNVKPQCLKCYEVPKNFGFRW